MSDKSRRRLLALLHGIKRNAALPVMQTLTFPEQVTVSAAEAKACRKAYEKRVARRYPNLCHVWRLEAHPEMSRRLGRMHPHFHLLTWGAWFDLEWISETWTDVVWSVLGIDDCLTNDCHLLVRSLHKAAGTRCEEVHKWAGVIYCAKTYIAKPEEYPLGKAGRVWGWFRYELLPLSEVEEVKLTPSQCVTVVRNVQAWMERKGIESDYLVRQFFTDDPEHFVALLLTPGAHLDTC